MFSPFPFFVDAGFHFPNVYWSTVFRKELLTFELKNDSKILSLGWIKTLPKNLAPIPQNGQTHSKNCLCVFDHFVWLALKGLIWARIALIQWFLSIILTSFCLITWLTRRPHKTAILDAYLDRKFDSSSSLWGNYGKI